jgi:MinD superfamily P-loop ATPase
MLCCLWSPKGGSGTSVFAAVVALVLARTRAARLADFTGDQPGVLGVAGVPEPGLGDWLRAGPGASAAALDRLAVDVAPGLSLLVPGRTPVSAASPEAGAALAVALRDDSRPTVADAGTLGAPALEALSEVADASVLVTRGCYLALRRGVVLEATARAAGVVVVEEPGRSIGAREVGDVLGLRVLATIPVRQSIARAVDAGVLAARPPDAMERAAQQLLTRLGIDREGRAA